MSDKNQASPIKATPETASKKYLTKTDAITDILEGEFFKTARNPGLIAYAIDKALNRLGFSSSLHSQYEEFNRNAIKNNKACCSLDEVMQRNGINEPAIIKTRDALNLYREQLMSERQKMHPGHQDKTLNHSAAEKMSPDLPKSWPKLLNVASPIVNSFSIAVDYKEAMERVNPYVDQKLMSAETARDYAVAITEGRLEQNATIGLSHDLGNARIGQWVKDHPEVPNEIMQELGLGGVREMQKLMAGPDFEA